MTTNDGATHWHIALLGADGSDGFLTATDVAGLGCLDDQISTELDRYATDAHHLVGILVEQAQTYRADGNHVGELDTLRDMAAEWVRAENLTLKAQAFRYTNVGAPAYVDNAAGWTDRVLVMIGETFPVSITHNEQLNVWQCPVGAACDHLSDEE